MVFTPSTAARFGVPAAFCQTNTSFSGA